MDQDEIDVNRRFLVELTAASLLACQQRKQTVNEVSYLRLLKLLHELHSQTVKKTKI